MRPVRAEYLRSARVLWLLPVFIVACLGAWAGPAARAQESTVSEHSVKAAFLYKFLGYVEWPAGAFPAADTPITIGVVGAADVAAQLLHIASGRTVNERSIAVRALQEGDAPGGVHVLFVGHSARGRIAEFARSAGQRAVLVVTETRSALAQGSMINFVLVDGKVRFEVSLETAETAGLKLSSRMLAVAMQVQTERR